MTEEERTMNEHLSERQERVSALLNEPFSQPARKPRSDKGIPKGPKVATVSDMIQLTVSRSEAEAIFGLLGDHGYPQLAMRLLVEAMAQLQKQIDALKKLQTK